MIRHVPKQLALALALAVVMALLPSACREHLGDEPLAAPDAGGGGEAGTTPQEKLPTFVITQNGQPATALTIAEGGVGWISVALTEAPSTPVSASVQLSQLGVVSVIPALVIFDATNYNVPQTVTITVPKDANTADESIELHLSASGYADGVLGLTVKDADVQTLLVTPEVVTVTEGRTDTFMVRPAFAPVGTMTINLASEKPGAATVSPATLTFTAADFKTPKPVTITGANDANTADESTGITLDSTGMAQVAVAVTVVDKDVQNMAVSPSSVTLTEGGAAGTFGVSLTQAPTGNVTVTVASTDPGAATASPATLTFTPGNYATAQTVTVTPVQDTDTLDETISVVLTSAGLTQREVTVNVRDDDVQSIVLSGNNVNVNEAGTATFTVKLAFDPQTPLTVSLLSSNTAAVTVSPSTLTFTTADFGAAQTVTVTGVVDANTTAETVAVPLTATGLAPQTVTARTIDKDVQDIVLSAATATTLETGSTTVTAQLAFAPVATTTVTVASSDTTALTVAPATLTFTAANYNAPQTVTLSGVNGAGTTDRTANATFASTGLPSKPVAVTVVDSSAVSLVVTPNTITTTETSPPSTFTVALSRAPTANVTVAVASSNTAAATVAPASLTFTAANYATPQTVTVTPVRDTNAAADTSTVSLTAAGVATQSVSVRVNDVDTQAIVASATTVSVTEGTSTATFTVRLTSAPAATTSVSVTSGNTAAVTAAPASLTFTTANYATPQTVTLTGVADTNAAVETVTLTLASAGIPNATVTATTVDTTSANCDPPGTSPTPTSGQHQPGNSCISASCHGKVQKSLQPLTVAGTLYGSVTGGTAVAQATIHLIDSSNPPQDIKVVTATNGNFWTSAPVVYPIRVRASKCPNVDQSMVSTVASSGGNCNGCHSSGSNQGRIHLP